MVEVRKQGLGTQLTSPCGWASRLGRTCRPLGRQRRKRVVTRLEARPSFSVFICKDEGCQEQKQKPGFFLHRARMTGRAWNQLHVSAAPSPPGTIHSHKVGRPEASSHRLSKGSGIF